MSANVINIFNTIFSDFMSTAISNAKDPEYGCLELDFDTVDHFKQVWEDNQKKMRKMIEEMVEKDKERHTKEMEEYNQKKNLEISEDSFEGKALTKKY